MAAGLQVDKNYINQKVGSLALQLRETLRTAGVVSAALSGYDHAGLLAIGFADQDATDLLDALYALGLLASVANGVQSLPTATDLMVGLRKVTGID